MRKLKIGLALGSGAARGLAHIGVIRALREGGVDINVISGTSIGAVIGGLCAAGLTTQKLADFAEEFGKKRISYWMDPSFFRKGGLLKGDKIKEVLSELIGPIDFDDLMIPFYAVATDLVTGKEVVISRGDVAHAIRASFAIPGVFAPIEHDGCWLIDGAISEPIPTRVLRAAGCDVIIAVNVTSVSEDAAAMSFRKVPKILDVMMQTLIITQQKISEPCMKLAHVNIVPDVGNYDWIEFSKSHEIIEAGYDETIKAMPHIKSVISRKRKFFFFSRLFHT